MQWLKLFMTLGSVSLQPQVLSGARLWRELSRIPQMLGIVFFQGAFRYLFFIPCTNLCLEGLVQLSWGHLPPSPSNCKDYSSCSYPHFLKSHLG